MPAQRLSGCSGQPVQPGGVGLFLSVLHPCGQRSGGICQKHPRLPESQPARPGHAAEIWHLPGGFESVELFSPVLSRSDVDLSRPQVLMVRFCSLFDAKERAVTFLNGQTYSLASLRALGMGSLLDAMFDFSEKLGSMGLEPDEMALFMAVVLVSAGKLTFLHISHLVPFPTKAELHFLLSRSRSLGHRGCRSCGAAAGKPNKGPALPHHQPSPRRQHPLPQTAAASAGPEDPEQPSL